MRVQHKRQLERELAKGGGLGWNKARTAISIMAQALDRWGYIEPKEGKTPPALGTAKRTAVHRQGQDKAKHTEGREGVSC